jgi:3-hydroxy-9,10-secoandrosta-1,3,5(10)-triene-9,17-dione monooxygenase
MQAAQPALESRLVHEAKNLIEPVRKFVETAERERTAPEAAVRAIVESGAVRHFVPERWGGRDGGWRDFVEATFVVSRTSASLAWVYSFLVYHAKLLCHFPEEAQRSVWGGDGPDARIAATYAPVGKARRVDGGYRLDGRWSWCSGVMHCDWIVLGALCEQAERGNAYKLLLVPKKDVVIVDTWDVMGLRGSGSQDVQATDCFVPDAHVSEIAAVRDGVAVGAARNTAPMVFTATLSLSSPVVGTVLHALESFRSVAASRPLAKEDGVLGRLSYAEVVGAVERSLTQLRAVADRADRGGTFSLLERAQARFGYASAVHSSLGAMNGLLSLAGPRTNYADSETQRAWRDVQAMSQHRILDYQRAADVLARVELGMDVGKVDWLY